MPFTAILPTFSLVITCRMSRITELNLDEIKASDLLDGFDFQAYNEGDRERWKILLDGVLTAQNGVACQSYTKGMAALGENFSDLPNLEELNHKLEAQTGWKVMAVNGILPCEDFYKLLSKKIFPSATFVRDWHTQAFTGYPDLFHDVVGHLPLFFDPSFSEFVSTSSDIIYQILRKTPNGSAEKERLIQNFSRYGWFTWETGLLIENGVAKAYGGAILSSSGETENLKTQGYDKFNLQDVFNQSYTDKTFSCRYFAIESYKDLFASLETIKTQYNV